MIQFKKLNKNAVIPLKAHITDAGLDLVYTGRTTILLPGEWGTFDTGLAMAIPEGTVGLIWPRSGLSVKSGIDTLAGVIDSSYRGEIKVVLINLGNEHKTIKTGDKIAQLVIQEVFIDDIVEVDQLSETIRGTNGFGSTGA
jgi:dUTP pyrophosphatase